MHVTISRDADVFKSHCDDDACGLSQHGPITSAAIGQN